MPSSSREAPIPGYQPHTVRDTSNPNSPANGRSNGNNGPAHTTSIEPVVDSTEPIAKTISARGSARNDSAPPATKGMFVPVLGGVAVSLLVVTGFYPALIPWSLATLIGGGYILWQLGRNRWPFPKPDALTTLALLGAAIAAAQLGFSQTSCAFCTLTWVQFWAGSLILLPLLRDSFMSLKKSPKFAWGSTFAISALFTASLIHGLSDVYFPRSADATPFWLPFVYRNHLVALVVLALPPLLWNLLYRRRYRLGSVIAVVLGISGVLASGSRSGAALLGVELALFGALIFRSMSHRQRLWAGGSLFGLLVAFIGLGGTAVLEYRLEHQRSLFDGRIDYWIASIQMIGERPLLGWGFGTWPDVYRQFLVNDNGLIANRAHSDWLEWTAEGGVAVTLMLLWLLFRSLQKAFYHPWALGLPLLLIYGMVDYTLRQPFVWGIFLILWLAAASVTPTPRRSGGTP